MIKLGVKYQYASQPVCALCMAAWDVLGCVIIEECVLIRTNMVFTISVTDKNNGLEMSRYLPFLEEKKANTKVWEENK